MLTRYKKAFTEPINLLTLIGFGALTPAFGDPLPLFLAGAGEALYLIYVPESRWYVALQDRRAFALRKLEREKLSRELLSSADEETRSAPSRIERIYSGYRGGAAASPETAARYEALLEQYIRFVAKESVFERQMREIARVSGVPDDVFGVQCNRRIVEYCLEQITMYRGLLQSVGDTARESNVADAERQIVLMEERITYVETASRLFEEVTRERMAIETTFAHLADADGKCDTADGADAVRQNAERLRAKLEQFAPHEARVTRLIGA